MFVSFVFVELLTADGICFGNYHDRTNCGYYKMGHYNCAKRGCCFDSNPKPENKNWCFYPSSKWGLLLCLFFSFILSVLGKENKFKDDNGSQFFVEIVRKIKFLCYFLSQWCLISRKLLKVAPYSFLTARELVSKSRDGASFQKSTRKSRATRVTRTGRILATIVAHFQCVSHP